VSILRENGRENELRGSIVKSRDGEELSDFLRYDFSQRYVVNNVITDVDFKDVIN